MRLLLYQSLPLRERSGCRNSLSFRASDRRHWRGNPFPAPVGAEHPSPPSVPERLSKGTFRAPARGTFAPGGKSTQKRRSNLRFENPLRAFTCFLSCQNKPRERCAVEISPKYCIVSASLFAVAFALKCRAVQPCYLWQDCFYKWRPKAATYLCREAAKARFDNRTKHRVGFPKGRDRNPSLLVASREKDF